MSKIASAEWYADWVRLIPASGADEKMRNLEAADMLEDLAKRIHRWISVEERLPEKKGNYLVRCYFHTPGASYTYENIKIIHFRGKSKWATENEHITHWMPLPEPPEEGDDEG